MHVHAVIDIHMFVRIGTGPYTATDNITYFRSLPARQKKGVSYSGLINFQRKMIVEWYYLLSFDHFLYFPNENSKELKNLK